MAKWDYRVITVNTEYEVPFGGKITDSAESNVIIEKHLNIMGKERWELVSFLPALPMAQKWKGVDFANPWMYHAIFKRPSEE